jgi:5-oxoprolinase (ATP-hydrolysing) subunit A
MQGFGRRRMEITGDELYADTLYQMGALAGVCKVVGVPLQHVKPHGILYRMTSEDEKYIDTFLQAVADFDASLFILCPRSTPMYDRGVEKGLRMAAEALIDLGYEDDGKWVIERVKKERSPADVAARAVKVATQNKIDTVNGNFVDIDAVTVCCHGDAPGAVDEVKAVVDALKGAGIAVGPIAAMSAPVS